MGPWGYGATRPWGYGAVGLCMGLWGRGVMGPWGYGALRPCLSGVVGHRGRGPAVGSQTNHHFRRLRALLSSRRLLNNFRRSSYRTEPLPETNPPPPFPPVSSRRTIFGRLIFPPIPIAHVPLPVPTTSGFPDFRSYNFRSLPRGFPTHFRSSPFIPPLLSPYWLPVSQRRA